MPVFKPFRGVRPSDGYVQSFPTRPLSNFTQEEILQKSEEEFSYVKMVKPYLYGDASHLAENLGKVRANYEQLLSEGQLEQDELSYYLYNQTMPDGRVFRGLLGLVSVEEFLAGKIKKHEETLTHRKEKLANYLEGINLQAEPVLLTYTANTELEVLMDIQQRDAPVLSYKDSREAVYKIWKITDVEKMDRLREILAQIDAFYIADGHHRMGSTALYSERKKHQNPNHRGDEAYNFVYSFIVSDQSIKINDFNKVVKDLNGLTPSQFLEKLTEYFIIEKQEVEIYYPVQKHHICMYLGGEFYQLRLRDEFCSNDCLGIIDHYILEKYILKPILGIDDLKTSKRVDYLRGTSCPEGIKRLKAKVDEGGYEVAFGAYPVSFNDLIEVADKSLKMPPKCTYIEPKLITALLMYDMK